VSWPEICLEDLLEDIQPGFASGQNTTDGILQVRMNNVKPDGSWDWSKERRVPATIRQLEKYSLQPGDILFNATNSPEQVGKSALFLSSEEPVTFSNHFLRLRVKKNKLEGSYLIRYLASLWKKRVFENMIDAWVNQATVQRDSFLALQIPVPPLDEQKRIAAILDKADSLRRKNQQAIQLADKFLRAVFLDMFGDPVTNPKGWEVKPICSIADVKTGNTPPRAQPEFYGGYIEWIKSDNINTPRHTLTSASEYLSKEGYFVGRKVPQGSTLITCIAGSFDCIGNVAFADREICFNQQINALVPLTVKPWFLYAMILFSKKKIQAVSTNAMKGMVSKGVLEKVEVIYPPIDLQIEFEKLFENQRKIMLQTETSKQSADNAFFSLSQKAFAGEL
jgi:type I restriction enzyme S subunit